MIQTVSCEPLVAALLGEKGVLRVMAADGGDDLVLGRVIDLGDEVVASLGGHREGFQAVEAADDDFAGAARGAHGNIEKRLHGNLSSYHPSAA